MKFKLDETLGNLGKHLLVAAGNDVMTVGEQQIVGISDRDLFDVCQSEYRVLMTFDLDFAQFLRFLIDCMGSTIVLNCRGRHSPATVEARVRDVFSMLRHEDPTGAL